MKLSELALILNILNDEEKALYKVFFKSPDGKPSKAEQLFDYLLEHPKVAEKKVMEIFYGKGKNAASAFSHLKTKLRNQLGALLIISDLKKTDDYPNSDILSLKKIMLLRILEATILGLNFQVKTSLRLFHEVHKTAKEYEFFDLYLLTYNFLVGYFANKGLKEIAIKEKELDEMAQLFVRYNKGELMLWKISELISLKGSLEQPIRLATEYSDILKKWKDEFKSDKITKQYYEAQCFLTSMLGDKEGYMNYSKKFYDFINSSKTLRQRSSIRIARNQLIDAYLVCGKYEEADKLAFDNHKDTYFFNKDNAFDTLFRSALYAKQYDHCREYLKILEKNIFKDEFIYAQYHLNWAVLNFFEKNYDEVFVSLSKTGYFMTEKTGWALGIKLIEIFTFIEMGQFDLVEFRIKAFRQLLYRNKQAKLLRIRHISEVLFTLLHTGFSFRKTAQKESDILDKLRESKGDFYWDPTGLEVIRFDWWFDDICKRKL